MTDLYLIRHGQYSEELLPASFSPWGPPLSPLGISQAERLRDRLAATREINADVLLASPLTRTRQTAEIIAPALGLPVTVEHDLREFRIGSREDLSGAEIVARYGLVDFATEPLRPVTPEGESWSRFTERVFGAFERITRAYDGRTIVAVCHDGIVAASFLYFFGLENLRFVKGIFRPAYAQLYTNTTSITYWHKSLFRDFQAQEPQWTLARYNDDVHLYDMASPARIPWQDISVRFEGGPGSRPVRVVP